MKMSRDAWYAIAFFGILLVTGMLLLWEPDTGTFRYIGRHSIQLVSLLLLGSIFLLYYRSRQDGQVTNNNAHYLEQIRISNERYSFVSRATKDCIWDWNLLTNKVYRDNKKLETLFGYPAWEADEVDTQWRKHVHPDDWEKLTKERALIFEDPKQAYWEGEYRFLKPDGDYAFVWDCGYIIRDHSGRPIRMIGASNDISKRKETEMELLRSEKRFRSLVEKGSEIIAMHDRNGTITYVSPSSFSVLGYDPAERTGQSALDHIHPDDLPVISEKLAALLKTPGSVNRAQWRHLHQNGSWRWMEGVATNLLEDPSVQAVVHNFRDITEQKEATERLRDEKESLDSFINSLPGVFYCYDKEGRFMRWNTNMAKVTGYSDSEIATMHPLQFIAEADGSLVAARIGEVFEKGFAEVEAGLRLKDGRIIPYYFNGKLVMLGGEDCLVGMGIDIAARRQNEEQLKLFQSVVMNANDGVLITEARPIEGGGPKIVYANEAFSRISGFTQEELLGATPRILQGKDTDREKLAVIKKALLHLTPVQVELLNYKKDGTPFWVSISISPVKNNLGECTHFIAIQNDVSERKAREKALQDQKAELKGLQEYLQQAREEERRYIAREVHDELGQLATAIKIDIDWFLLQAPKWNEQSVKRSNHASRVTDILISSIRKIAHKIRPSVLDDFGLVAALKLHCEEFSALNNIPVSFYAELDERNMPDTYATEIFRIVQESMTNIMRHAKASEVQVSMREGEDRIFITITDNGVGFDTNSSKKTLGLIGIRERAVSLNGQMHITSKPGQGTTIAVSFPRPVQA